MLISAFLTLIFVICTGEYPANASVHSDPARVPGCTLGSEDEHLLSGSAFCSHSDRSSAHVHDWQALLCHGNEMSGRWWRQGDIWGGWVGWIYTAINITIPFIFTFYLVMPLLCIFKLFHYYLSLKGITWHLLIYDFCI